MEEDVYLVQLTLLKNQDHCLKGNELLKTENFAGCSLDLIVIFLSVQNSGSKCLK